MQSAFGSDRHFMDSVHINLIDASVFTKLVLSIQVVGRLYCYSGKYVYCFAAIRLAFVLADEGNFMLFFILLLGEG